jgi:hypothetical protein
MKRFQFMLNQFVARYGAVAAALCRRAPTERGDYSAAANGSPEYCIE